MFIAALLTTAKHIPHCSSNHLLEDYSIMFPNSISDDQRKNYLSVWKLLIVNQFFKLNDTTY